MKIPGTNLITSEFLVRNAYLRNGDVLQTSDYRHGKIIKSDFLRRDGNVLYTLEEILEERDLLVALDHYTLISKYRFYNF